MRANVLLGGSFVHEDIESLVQLVIDSLSLHLFSHQVKDDAVNTKIELLNCLFTIFSSAEESDISGFDMYVLC